MKGLNTVLATSLVLTGMVVADVQAATEWNVSLWGKRRAFTENVEKLAELVEQKTNGEFKLKLSYGGLSKSRENLDGISFGAFEMAQFCSFYHTDKNPTITVTELPFSKDVSLARVGEIYMEVFKHPEVTKDLARWNATLLMPTPLPQYNIASKSDEMSSLEHFDGLRVRGPGGIMGVLGKLGAVKTSVPFSEVRQSMDSGVIDAASFAPHAHLATNSYKVANWVTTNLNLGSANCPVVVNSEALEMLKPAHKEALLGSVDEALAYYVENYEQNTTAKFDAAIAQEKVTQVTFTPDQTLKLNDLAASVRQDWVDKYKDRFDSQALFDFTEKQFAQK
ncbi:TRAP transporter substrate-binding protein DctP [Vibrio sp. ZSDZ34]|uniref:TRAP transporter substrate-binding protein DctP n=1 Tax=Vibrio gelatinilyticus TaxID=2893468 RepID=A0A9X2B014_9VIBR|nr:TRAP transporter substrate-binding protein DctP [Vibrio gelatinilyticus]MCJ2378193.1 TRAP transporter substrate-binding protein DctP [Vibrio gelatinilyticus]